MSKLFSTFTAIGLLSLLAACAQAAPASPTPQPTAAPIDVVPMAQSFVDQLAKGDFAAAVARFDGPMLAAMPEAKLKETWQQVISQVGAFKQQSGTRTGQQSGYRIVWVTCQFENVNLDVQVVFNDQSQVSGLFFKPAQAPATPTTYSTPFYVKSGSFRDEDVTVGSGDWAVPGTLSLPQAAQGSGPFPAVVLVSGSGPNDRDESVGPNKPFRDLAWGLASQGVAVLRYDKRTLAHANLYQATPDLVDKITVQDEFIDDTLLAVKLLRQTPQIDPRRIFVAGHSEGAYVAPRVGQQDPSLAGLILIAAPTRPLEDLVIDQYTYLFSLNGGPTLAQTGSLAAMQAQADKVKDPNLSPSTSRTDLPLGIPARYWLDLRGYQPAELAKTLSMPLLILQGGRDYQVSATRDFPGWQAALSGRPDATLKLYPALNHLLLAGEKPSTPEEYAVEGHVSEEIVNDIAAWVLKH